MNHISNSMNQYFTRSSFSPSFSRQADSQRQPTIRSLPENNVDTGIDIHSIDYEFPLQKKAETKVAEPIARLDFNMEVAEKPSGSVQMNASEPTFKDPISTRSKNAETSPAMEPIITEDDEEISGFSANSFFDSIRFSDFFSLELHIEHGFKGSQEFMLGTEKYNAFDYAMHCKNFQALMALAPTVKASNIISALEKNPTFYEEYTKFTCQLFNALN